MKKIITLIIIALVFWGFGLNAKADTIYVAPDGNEYEYMTLCDTSSVFGYKVKVYSHYPFALCSVSPYGSDYRLVTVINDNGTEYCGFIATVAASYSCDFTGVYPGNHNYFDGICISKENGDKPQYNGVIREPYQSSTLTVYNSYEDAYNALTYVEPTYYFDAAIPKPNFQVLVDNLPPWTGMPSTETNYFSFAFDDTNDFKIEIGYKYKSPSFINCGLNNGKVFYEPVTYYNSPYFQAYRGSAANISYIVNTLEFEWDAYITTNSPDYFGTTVPIWNNTWSNGAYNSARENWINKYSKCMPLYGNQIQIMARYYIEVDNDIYVGAWNNWNSTYPSQFTEEIPSNYQVGSYVPGVQSEVNQMDPPEDTINVGQITGSQENPYTQITINQSVPNYPDYPTVVSYNHDNVFITFLETANKLPSTFKGFSQFLTSAFAFIPSSIWSVIAFGLSCCIIVMIVKIL